jgi:hypothetical protein
MIERRRQTRKGLGTAPSNAALTKVCPPPLEDPMCWEMDYHWFAEQKKAQEAQQKKQQRTELIDKLLSEANQDVGKPEEATPVKESVPAK